MKMVRRIFIVFVQNSDNPNLVTIIINRIARICSIQHWTSTDIKSTHNKNKKW